jgi:hypothetical protein
MFSKTVHNTTFPLWSESLNLPFIRLHVKQKIVEALTEGAETTGANNVL